jgi:hypothetical protein
MPVAKRKPSNSFEIKSRQYYLLGDKEPVARKIRSRFMWFDENKGYEREIRYARNQDTEFVDEYKGAEPRYEHIWFEDGVLTVPREKVLLQKILDKHPDNGKIFAEKDEEKNAVSELDVLELEEEAILLAKDMDIELAEAIVRVDVGSRVAEMTSSEIKRDLKLMARKNPAAFIELANDENIDIRNKGIKAVEQGIIKLDKDNRTFRWAKTDRVLCVAKFDDLPYSALAAWFKTDEGTEVFMTVEKQIK